VPSGAGNTSSSYLLAAASAFLMQSPDKKLKTFSSRPPTDRSIGIMQL
jgi:hypothetical protein